MIKLIATDMDGTLLDERGEVDLPRLERLLDHLDQKGIRFVIATGNEIHRMRQLLGPLVKRVTLVVANGARSFENDQMVLGKFWDRELVEAVLDYFKGREISDQLVVSAVNGGFVKEGTVFTEVEKFMQPEVIEALYKRMKFDQVLKMSLVVGLDRLDQVSQEVQQAFGDQLMAVSSGFGSMDLLQAGIHKAWGLAQLMEKWQLDASQVMAFGDSGNDIEMLEMAAHSYAVANADEAVMAVAKHLAPSHQEGGVYQVIEEYLGLTPWEQVKGKK